MTTEYRERVARIDAALLALAEMRADACGGTWTARPSATDDSAELIGGINVVIARGLYGPSAEYVAKLHNEFGAISAFLANTRQTLKERDDAIAMWSTASAEQKREIERLRLETEQLRVHRDRLVASFEMADRILGLSRILPKESE